MQETETLTTVAEGLDATAQYTLDSHTYIMTYKINGKRVPFDLLKVFGEMVKIDNKTAKDKSEIIGSQDYLGDVASLMDSLNMAPDSGFCTWGQADQFYTVVCLEGSALKKKFSPVKTITA